METDEELETGRGPRTPPGDNLCNDHVVGLAEGYASLAAARGDAVEVDDGLGLTLIDRGSPSLFANTVVAARALDGTGWQAAAARALAFFGARPGGAFLLFSPWPTPDLRPLGFGLVGHPPLMVRPPGPAEGRPVEGLAVREVADAEAAAHWERALVEGYPDPGLQPFRPGCLLPPEALGVPRWRHLVGYLGGQPVASASAWVGDHHVDVEFVACTVEARGRGVGRAMTIEATVGAGPDRPAMLIASDDGRPVYERLGYRAVLRYTLWAGHRPA